MGDDACFSKKILTSLTKQETVESTTTKTDIKHEFSQIVFEGGQSNAPLLLWLILMFICQLLMVDYNSLRELFVCKKRLCDIQYMRPL